MTYEYEPVELEDGTVLQSGIPSPEEESLPPPYQNTYGFISRGVILKTYYTDDSGWNDSIWSGAKGLHADVRVFGRRQRVLTRVPVCTGGFGDLWDEDTTVPRAASMNIGGGQLVTDASPSGSKPTEAHNMDGAHVLVGFLDCDPLQPIIFPFALPHPSMGKDYKEADGRVRRIRHNGTLIEWGKDGNLTIDAQGAAQGALGNAGSEVSSSGTGGEILMITSDGSNKTSIHLDNGGNIRLGSDPASAATEPLVLGNLWISVMEDLIDAILNLTVGTGTGPSSTPINYLDFQAVRTAITGKTHVSDFIFAKKAP